jgi:hypothetical protein
MALLASALKMDLAGSVLILRILITPLVSVNFSLLNQHVTNIKSITLEVSSSYADSSNDDDRVASSAVIGITQKTKYRTRRTQIKCGVNSCAP